MTTSQRSGREDVLNRVEQDKQLRLLRWSWRYEGTRVAGLATEADSRLARLDRREDLYDGG